MSQYLSPFTRKYLPLIEAAVPMARPPAYAADRIKEWFGFGSNKTEEATRGLTEVIVNDAIGRPGSKGRIRSSVLGDCPRKQALSYWGLPEAPVPTSKRLLFDAGHYLHYMWQHAGLSSGVLVSVEHPIHLPDERFSSSADGICDDNSIFEFKSVNARSYEQAEYYPQYKHVLQVNAYMWAHGTDRASVVYQNRDDPSKVVEWRLAKSDAICKQLAADFAAIRNADPLKPPHVYFKCITKEGPYNGCGYRFICNPEGNKDGSPVTFDIND